MTEQKQNGRRRLDNLSKGTASMFDANMLIYRSLLAFENERISIMDVRDFPAVYYDLRKWFEIQTGEKYSIENVTVQIEVYEHHEKKWELEEQLDREREIDAAFDKMMGKEKIDNFFDELIPIPVFENRFEEFKQKQEDIADALVKGINYEKIKEDLGLNNPLESFKDKRTMISEGNRELRRKKDKENRRNKGRG